MTAEAHQPKSTRYRNWMAVGLVLCLIWGTALLPEKPGLLKQSTKAMSVDDGWLYPYHWLSDHQILFSRTVGLKGLFCYDTRLQKETYLGAISRELEKVHYPECLESLCVSPDGSRLLWGGDREDTVYGAWLDGTHYFACVPGRDAGSVWWTQVRWTTDSRHWFSFVSDQFGVKQAMLFDGDASHKPATVSIAASYPSNPLGLMRFMKPLSLVLNHHILASEWFDYPTGTPTLDVIDIGLGIPAAVLKTRHIDMPPDASILEVAFSPQGDRLAWFLSVQAVPQWERFLHRLLPRFAMRGPWAQSLWVSDVDGTRMHEIGSRNLERSEEFRPQLDQLQWTPDGKRLSYLYRSSLYTVAAK